MNCPLAPEISLNKEKLEVVPAYKYLAFESFDSHLAKFGCIDCSFEHLNVESINLARGRVKPKTSSAGFASLTFFFARTSILMI